LISVMNKAIKDRICEGGGAPKELVDFTDLVTEMQNIKHPYSQGIKAQPGIDF